MKILVVDDDQFSRRLITGKLEHLGHNVIIAEQGVEAVHILQSDNEISLMITDWIMPQMDGLTLCQKARLLEREFYLPIILLTSRSEKEDLIEGLNAGADAFLSKPLNFAELQAHIKVTERILKLEKRLASQILDLKEAHQNLKEAHDKIEEIARVDHLTQLPNRRSIMETLEKEITRAERYNSFFSVLILDIDHFKKINDQYGHLVGDTVLHECGKILAKSVRLSDTVGRYGGEEFLGILPETTLPNGEVLGNHIRKIIKEMSFPVEQGIQIHLTVSIGIAEYLPKRDNLSTLLNRADQALYQAKNNGRDCVCIDPSQ